MCTYSLCFCGLFLLPCLFIVLSVYFLFVVVMATGATAQTHVGDVEEDASQLLFPKGDVTLHECFDRHILHVFLLISRDTNRIF